MFFYLELIVNKIFVFYFEEKREKDAGAIYQPNILSSW